MLSDHGNGPSLNATPISPVLSPNISAAEEPSHRKAKSAGLAAELGCCPQQLVPSSFSLLISMKSEAMTANLLLHRRNPPRYMANPPATRQTPPSHRRAASQKASAQTANPQIAHSPHGQVDAQGIPDQRAKLLGRAQPMGTVTRITMIQPRPTMVRAKLPNYTPISKIPLHFTARKSELPVPQRHCRASETAL